MHKVKHFFWSAKANSFGMLVFAIGQICFFPTYSLAEGFHLRAREHYETIDVGGGSVAGDKTYSGFTNTLHFGYEKPFHYLIGISGSPLFAILSKTGGPESENFGKKIRLVHIGFEAKGFPVPMTLGLFLRFGIYRATMQTNGTQGVLSGTSSLAGLGYEWNLSGIGIAPEIAWRKGWLQESVHFKGSAPAIGVHFYKLI